MGIYHFQSQNFSFQMHSVVNNQKQVANYVVL